MLKFKKLVLGLNLLLSISAMAAVTLSPSTFGEKIDFDNSGYKEYTIKNDSPNRARYKLSFNTSSVEDRNKFDINIYPKAILIEPYSEKIVKVVVNKKAKVDIPDGEYKFTAGINPLTIPTLQNEKSVEGIALQGKAGVSLMVEMTGYVGELGDISKDVKFENIKFNKESKNLSFTFNNNMKRSVKITVIAYKNRNEKETFADYIRVAKETKYKVNIPLKNLDKINYIEFYNSEGGELISKISL